ncbi:MAG: nucleotidyl transferase AbiEii/AbiGii toxin family protein [Lachnospiraceae bacterium]|nr:nucleotidyl transferase AbiEii/AbiGii toxin family protein [Lachnospiraceae bacterium]
MNKVALMPDSDRQELFQATALSMGLRTDVIEKDFWVCYMLNHLFHKCKYKDLFVFKGGTSLSKSYHVINRFSEDIDLIIDWRKIIKDGSNPWDDRSKNKQYEYNKRINSDAVFFYKNELIPQLDNEISFILGKGIWIELDKDDDMVINFNYPKLFDTDYIIPHVRLEIGPLAEWIPSHKISIQPFAAEKYPMLFSQKETKILTIDVERTFWEKLTILHKLSNFPEDKVIPHRYARHLYDVYCMGNSWVKKKAFERKELLEKDALFKQKFYYSKGAHYESATLSDIKLIPDNTIQVKLKEDYKAMHNMIYGKIPEFEEIIEYLEELQKEIHMLDKNILNEEEEA